MLKRLTQNEQWQIKAAQYAWLVKKGHVRPTVFLSEAKTPLRKLKPDRQKHLINIVIDVLSEGKPTPFAFEGASRQGVRSGLCLDGWPWRDADAAAAEVVTAALKRMGATRPTWWQGQPESAAEGLTYIERTFCDCCGGKMPKIEVNYSGLERRYCSKHCNEISRNRYERTYGQQRTAAEFRMQQRAAGERKRQLNERKCLTCAKPYIPRQLSTNSRYCSQKCFGISHRGRRVPLPKCVTCGKECKQKRTRYCSRACFRATIARPNKTCEVCSKVFYPPELNSKTCSKECRYKSPNLGRRRKNRC